MKFTTQLHLTMMKFLGSLLVLICSTSLISSICYGGIIMNDLYELKKTTVLTPQVFEGTGLFGTNLFGGYTNVSLFTLPLPNSVGSTQMGNAITEISFSSFPGKRISFDRHFRNDVENMDVSEVFMPLVSKDVIGVGQPRRFTLYDFKKKIQRTFTITPDISETISKAVTVDARQNLFMFEIGGHTGNSPNPWDISSSLMLMDLSGKTAKPLKEMPVERYFMWSVVGDKNFLYRNKTKQFKVVNMNLEPSHHPLADIITKHKNEISFHKIYAHPTLPFAILHWGSSGALVVTWGEVRDKAPRVLIESAEQFLFSPDGKWLSFRSKDYDRDTDYTYVMPVSEKFPYYLGSPIQIADDYFNDNKFAWTINPTSFVGSSGKKIYRCDLENRDFPGKGKMSFHDYVVQEDLKKLTREKRQGLGK